MTFLKEIKLRQAEFHGKLLPDKMVGPSEIGPSGTGLVHMKNLNIVISVPADGLAPNGCRLVSSQWETSLQSNAIAFWLSANLESALAL